MSLTASMWSSVSGLLNHGEKMNVIGNNIANVNTVGFKGSRMDFMSHVYSSVFAASGPSQIGNGVTVGAIYSDFGQGSFESSSEATDMAISGNGFFKVRDKYSNEEYYTRAGNFRFDATGYLVNPQGYVLQGWAIEQANASQASGSVFSSTATSAIVGTGVPVDVRLTSFSCDPRHTNSITMAVNLDADSTEKSTDATEPFASLFNNWDSTLELPLGNDGFAYQQSITVFDEGGSAHVLTVYFDRVIDNTGTPSTIPNGTQVWEFIVTMDPTEDIRSFEDPLSPGTYIDVPADKLGLLMTGTLTFNSSGQMTDMMAYVPTEGGTAFGNSSSWVAAPISANGYPMFAANFSGITGASEIWSTLPTAGAAGTINPETSGKLTEMNFGFQCTSGWWGNLSGTNLTMDGIANDFANLAGMGTAGKRLNPASTAFSNGGTGFYERYSSQDGFTFGELTNIYVTENGILTGYYSNGVALDLFQITMYDFNAKHELRNEGGNLYSETRASGQATQGAAGSGSFGTILGNNLEQSNVDISREFVQMITTQRGFQSNSKLITTTDTMLENVINMKR